MYRISARKQQIILLNTNTHRAEQSIADSAECDGVWQFCVCARNANVCQFDWLSLSACVCVCCVICGSVKLPRCQYYTRTVTLTHHKSAAAELTAETVILNVAHMWTTLWRCAVTVCVCYETSENDDKMNNCIHMICMWLPPLVPRDCMHQRRTVTLHCFCFFCLFLLFVCQTATRVCCCWRRQFLWRLHSKHTKVFLCLCDGAIVCRQSITLRLCFACGTHISSLREIRK